MQLWDVEKHALQAESPLLTPNKPVTALAFSANSNTLAVGFGQKVRLYDVSSQTEIPAPRSVSVGEVTALALSPDGETLAIGGVKTITLWDVRGQSQIGTPIIGHADMVKSMAFSPDAGTLATGGGGDDHQVKLWDTATQRQTGAVLASQGDINFLAFPDSNSLITAEGNETNDGVTVRHWNIAIPPDPKVAACEMAGAPLTPTEWRRYVPSSDIEYRDICPALKQESRSSGPN